MSDDIKLMKLPCFSVDMRLSLMPAMREKILNELYFYTWNLDKHT